MSEDFGIQWKSGLEKRFKSQPKRSSKLSFWKTDDYKSAKLKSNYGETEKLYSFDNPYYGHNEDNEDSDGNQHSFTGHQNNYFELKNRNIHGLGFDETNKQDVELNKNRSLIEYLNYQIQEKDSLQSIALRYGCSVSKIKQINHLITDREFYGLRVLRLPVKKYGILSDVLVHQVNSCSLLDSDNIPLNTTDFTEVELQKPRTNSLTVNIGISQHLNGTNSEDAFKFLNHMDEDLRKIRQSTKSVIESSNVVNLDQNTVALNESQVSITQSKLKSSAFFSCDESDYGINWCNLLLLAFVICFLVPILYVLYISESHNNTISNVQIHH